MSIPDILPISDDGKTELYLMLSAEFTTDGAHTTERLLDYASGWTGGEELLLPIDMTNGELSGVTLGAFYMTQIDDTDIHVSDADVSDENCCKFSRAAARPRTRRSHMTDRSATYSRKSR